MCTRRSSCQTSIPPSPQFSIFAFNIFTTRQDCRAEARGLKDALSSANSRLASLDALEAEARARSRELKELQEERRESNESLAEERGRTQHLVSVRKHGAKLGAVCMYAAVVFFAG